MLNPEVQILLSTFNGALFLEAQIESLLSQTFQNWQLLVRDDGSTDNTLSIIDKFETAHPQKIQLIKGNEGGSSTKSFMGLLKTTTAPYIMFCDQDDIWLSNKIELSLSELKKIEKNSPNAAVYCDMEVVNSDLERIHQSFLASQALNPSWRNNAYAAFAQSMAAGCCMIFTKSLKDLLHPMDSDLFQHDHWILMHAAYYGKIGYVDQSLLKYRQHLSNTIGSHKIGVNYFSNKIKTIQTIWNRWSYIHTYFQPSPSIFRIALQKTKLNLLRLFKS